MSATPQQVPIEASLQFGWRVFKENAPLLVGLMIVIIVINMVIGAMESVAQGLAEGEASAVLWIALFIVRQLINALITLGMVHITLRLCDGERPTAGEFFAQSNRVLPYIGATIMLSLILIPAFLLLIVPGVILMLGLMFYAYLIIDYGMGPIASLQRSWEITRGAKMGLFLFVIVLILINMIGALCCLVGLIVTAPVSQIASAYVYRTLLAAQAGSVEIAMEPPLDPPGPSTFE